MASVTRSSRRAEGLHPHQHHSHHHLTPSAGVFGPGQGGAGGGGGGGGRNKRALDTHEHDFDAIKPKRTRITVEILAKGNHGLSDTFNDNNKAPPPARTTPRPPAAATPTVASATKPPNDPPPANNIATPAPKQEQSLTKHQSKVINGIKHELDRLQPQAKDTNTRDQGRKLRSQEATRFKSDLSAYFPEYDEVIGNEPKEQHLFNIDTPIVVVDNDPQRAVANTQRAGPHLTDEPPVRGYGDALFNDVFDAQRIDFSFLEAQFKKLEDPLPDKLFQPVHRRAERLERSIRNTEKGRAQHEKDQIIRLLEGLQGHDWLRIMGVSGVTETKKKTFEPARDHFIRGCQAILAKFRNWVLEEKRRKQEKDRARAEKEEEGSASAEEDDDAEDEDGVIQDSSDSASPAKQLRDEAMARSKSSKGSQKRKATPQPAAAKALRPSKAPPAPKPPEPPKEFKSFFSKNYERESALHRHRRTGRKVLAWGHPIPEIPQVDFDLPEEYRDDDTLKTRARKKRRDRRSSKQ
ncbi:hypothetical protein FZEAL_5566 [Fusarium zealandicum]|uniref:Something about silencing protein 4 domain-containing protein n=1 Tax=Fusarium zealandicum TaxID=1053134 RepID=A0A8H4UJX7_9HYPO|nr:hypothetical protein FZEAL_5566 [Fusarium zealandicum]